MFFKTELFSACSTHLCTWPWAPPYNPRLCCQRLNSPLSLLTLTVTTFFFKHVYLNFLVDVFFTSTFLHFKSTYVFRPYLLPFWGREGPRSIELIKSLVLPKSIFMLRILYTCVLLTKTGYTFSNFYLVTKLFTPWLVSWKLKLQSGCPDSYPRGKLPTIRVRV